VDLAEVAVAILAQAAQVFIQDHLLFLGQDKVITVVMG
jgi:hypothetical protein